MLYVPLRTDVLMLAEKCVNAHGDVGRMAHTDRVAIAIVPITPKFYDENGADPGALKSACVARRQRLLGQC